ncbi:cysteine desulfurase family protein [Lacticigenium naphthae]|uniref:cysteine desulfurase family protein n=1 Tax=Lacticigenium naphthae TaxID=515351 RepID=UPI000401EF16|nr:cysteine desulfurase family protein [Lacticigenium naphthae]
MIYLDNSATTKMYPEVVETFATVANNFSGNPSSLHRLGEEASILMERSRIQIADLLGMSASEIVFTSGGTEGDNWVIKGTAIEKMPYGKHIITSTIEHPAVYQSMKQLETLGWEVSYVPVDENGIISVKLLEEALREDTVLVSVMAVNNEVGSIQPLKEIGKILENYPSIHFHVDAVQTLGKIPFNLNDYPRVDMAVFSAHKFHGPKGIGFVYIKKGRVLAPLLTGGGQENNLRSGTENLPAIVAMAKALRMSLDKLTDAPIQLEKQHKIIMGFLDNQSTVDVFSSSKGAPHIICFGISGIKGEVVVHALEKKGIYISTTSACSSKKQLNSSTLYAMNIPKRKAESAVRISMDVENTSAEIDQLVDSLQETIVKFKDIR